MQNSALFCIVQILSFEKVNKTFFEEANREKNRKLYFIWKKEKKRKLVKMENYKI